MGINNREQGGDDYREDAFLPELHLLAPAAVVLSCTTLLQAGVYIEREKGMTLGAFVCSCPGFTEQYIREEVQTIFVNGVAVDDLATLLTGKKSVVALSAAMPGLAGAIFRKSGLHASLRTVKEDKSAPEDYAGRMVISLKLFNKIARDIGPYLLRSGVTVSTEAFISFMSRRPELWDLVVAPDTLSRNLPVDQKVKEVKKQPFCKLFVQSRD